MNLQGGGSFSLFNLMLDLMNRHNAEPVLLLPNEDIGCEECRRQGIRVIIAKNYGWCGLKGALPQAKGLVKFILNKFYCYGHILHLISSQHFDLVHTNGMACQTGWVIAKHLGIPHVWHLREFGVNDWGVHYLYPDWYVRSKYMTTDEVVTVSRSLYEDQVNVHKYSSHANTRVIYNGLQVPDSYEKQYFQGDRVNFCITGYISSAKNQAMALRACEKLAELSDKFTLHIIGAVHYDYAEGAGELRNIAESGRLKGHVKFWGFRDDVSNILRNMDVGLMLSRCEAFGRVTVEYMANYMPVIGVDTGATPEIVLDGETGCICPLDDYDRLSELMHNFITHPELLHTMGEKGRERAVAHFSLEHNTDEIYSLYQEILSRR